MGVPPLERSIQYVKKIGPKRAAVLEQHGIRTVGELLRYYPFGYYDRSRIVPIKELPRYASLLQSVTVIGQVFRIEERYSARSRKRYLVVTVRDASGYVICYWFEGVQYLRNAFVVGETLALSAIPGLDRNYRPSFTHPTFDRLAKTEEDEPDWTKMFNTGALIPKYSSGRELEQVGLDSGGIRRVMRGAVDAYSGACREVLAADLLRKYSFPELGAAIRSIHFPADEASLNAARERLIYEELFFLQLLLAVRKRKIKEDTGGIHFDTKSTLARRLADSLPFQLTGAQKRVLREIAGDMGSPQPMNRLLQGDVGSGKTIVALFAMLVAGDNGWQAVMMAPTELLAEQHYATIRRFAEPLGVKTVCLIGAQRSKERREILEAIADGSAVIAVGTHALLEEPVEFRKLGLVIVDEQHRFGVMQRAALMKKGERPDVLIMTATPIPRTLTLTTYGDLDVSVIDELPPGRKPVKTLATPEQKKREAYDIVTRELDAGRQAYIVFPLIEKSEKVDLKAATEEYKSLRTGMLKDYSVGLLHGRMKAAEKDAIMQEFKNGRLQVLVSTTVIEVGIDVPNASVMVVESAERFGLSQLHQLRGRVGRGADQSYCLLIADYAWFGSHLKGAAKEDAANETSLARRRIETMTATTDGFRIAETDLELRGPGEVFGTRQSGMPEFRIADPRRDHEQLARAREDAFAIIANDPHLRHPDHHAMREHFFATYRSLLELSDVG